MKRTTWLGPVLLVGLAALLNACQLTGAPGSTLARPAASDQAFASPLPAPSVVLVERPMAVDQVESPLPGPAESRDCIDVAGLDGYQMVRSIEMQIIQADGSIQPNVTENTLLVTRTAGQRCNSHSAMTMIDPQTGKYVAFDETYVVDDLVYSYCTMCPPSVSGVWRVSRRSAGNEPGVARAAPAGPSAAAVPAGLTPTSLGPVALDLLVAQSTVVGNEAMNGFFTVHRRFTDLQTLADPVRWQVGAAPNDSLEVTTAQVDMWLTLYKRRLVRLRFQAEGKTQAVAGSGVLLPFAMTDEFNLTALKRATPIVVPNEVLAAVEPQLKALGGE